MVATSSAKIGGGVLSILDLLTLGIVLVFIIVLLR
jgi:hypothetical protein